MFYFYAIMQIVLSAALFRNTNALISTVKRYQPTTTPTSLN